MTHPTAAKPLVQSFFDPKTYTISHVVYDAPGGKAAVVDSVLDFDPKSGRTKTTSADRIVEFIQQENLHTEWLLESHAHADHLSAAPYLREQVGGKIAVGENIRTVQKVFKEIFNLEREFNYDGSQFDYLFKDGEVFSIGKLSARVLFVPGHTPACSAYIVGDEHLDDGSLAIFSGDTIFAPDVGTARCDFPGGDAKVLFQSVRKLLSLPAQSKIYLCHDYPPEKSGEPTRKPVCYATVADERAHNIHVRDGIDEDAFVRMRSARDATLEMPTLILPSVQVNIRAGKLPPAEDNGVHYLKVPLNAL